MSARAFYQPRLVSDFVQDFLGREVTRPLSDQERLKVIPIFNKQTRVDMKMSDITVDFVNVNFR